MNTMNTPQIDDGGPAFPAPEAGNQHFGDPSAYMGLAIRDWLAGKSIRAVEARLGEFNPDLIAERCYELADAMITARKYTP